MITLRTKVGYMIVSYLLRVGLRGIIPRYGKPVVPERLLSFEATLEGADDVRVAESTDCRSMNAVPNDREKSRKSDKCPSKWFSEKV